MAIIDFAHREITAKVVYFGAPGAGSNTNVDRLFELVPVNERGRLHRFGADDDDDASLFFDYVPQGGGQIGVFTTRYRVYSMPGGVKNATHREEVLRGADAVVFVADAREGRGQGNLDNLIELEGLLAEFDLALVSIPLVFQVNHSDAPSARTVAEVVYDLNPYGFEVVAAVARQGRGVLETHDRIVAVTAARIGESLAGNQAAISLTAVNRAARERDDDVIRRHVAAIRSGDSGEEPVDGALAAKGRGEPPPARSARVMAYAAAPEVDVVRLPFQPRSMAGTRPVHVLSARVEDGAVHLDVVAERLSGGDPRRVRVVLENRPIGELGLTGSSPTQTASAPEDPPMITSSLPDQIEFPMTSHHLDLPPMWYGLGGLAGGVIAGLLMGFLLFYA